MGNSNGKPIVLTDQVCLNHFRMLRVVGKGAFGKVRIVERKDTGLTFALKYIRKDEIVRSESVRNILRERRMLEHLNHPFLCNLRYSFQDHEYLYIVVDLMTGGDLRFHITRKTFTEDAVRFWIAELGCALRYIHGQGIIHRDVKPDNVLLDAEGHVHLADFNVASDFTLARPLTSRSGTLAYLAPEVYAGRGYYAEVDWWSLGVLFYECIYNKRPFEGSNQTALAENIMRAEPPFPPTNPPVTNPCLHAISSLLEKDKRKRIGAIDFYSFTDNPFFREIDFGALERKEIEPVFCPSSEKTNFDATHDLEELLLEEAPLEARAKRQKPRAELRENATKEEIRAEELHRMIETYFEPFDYTLLPQKRDPAQEGLATVVSNAPTPRSGSPKAGRSNAFRTNLAVSRPSSPNFSRSDGTSDAAVPRPGSPKATRSNVPRSGSPKYTRAYTDGPLETIHPSTLDRTAQSSRTQTPMTRSSAHSPDGSPPLSMHGYSSAFVFPNPALPSSLEWTQEQSRPGQVMPQTLNHSQRSDQLGAARPKRPGQYRSASVGRTIEIQLAQSQNEPRSGAVTPTEEFKRADTGKSGVLAFLSRKKGRDRSPKPGKERERGVLGKEGARVVIKDHSIGAGLLHKIG